ncbi:MAG: DUF4386 domain-containing protein [Terricaulis sp.]
MKTASALRMEARVAGFLYLAIMISAFFAEGMVRGGLVADGNAAETAKRILASESLYRLGGGADLIAVLCDVALAALFYDLLKPAGRALALLMAFFRLAYAAVFAVVALLHFAPLSVLTGHGLTSLPAQQAEAIAYLMIRLHTLGYNVALTLFGVHCVLLGALIARSGFLPAVLGWLLALVGVCYLVNSATHLVFTSVDFFPWILLPGLLGEGGLTLWLLIFGINAEKWQARAAA